MRSETRGSEALSFSQEQEIEALNQARARARRLVPLECQMYDTKVRAPTSHPPVCYVPFPGEESPTLPIRLDLTTNTFWVDAYIHLGFRPNPLGVLIPGRQGMFAATQYRDRHKESPQYPTVEEAVAYARLLLAKRG